jgi:hypothetical protein
MKPTFVSGVIGEQIDLGSYLIKAQTQHPGMHDKGLIAREVLTQSSSSVANLSPQSFLGQLGSLQYLIIINPSMLI